MNTDLSYAILGNMWVYCLCILAHSVYYFLHIVLLSFVLDMLKRWVPALAISPGIVFISCLLFLLFQAVDW